MLPPLPLPLRAWRVLGRLKSVMDGRNSLRVLPKRMVDRGHPEDGPWGRWARFVLRRPIVTAAVGIAVVGVLAGIGTQLTPNEAQLKNFPGSGTAIQGRQLLADGGTGFTFGLGSGQYRYSRLGVERIR